jgi:hypothetical protein
MLLPCEKVVRKYLPAIRAGLIRTLYKDYNLGQVEIASKLGITQAAVSKYIIGNYTPEIKKLENKKEIKSTVGRLASSITKQNIKKPFLANMICEACINLEVCTAGKTKR